MNLDLDSLSVAKASICDVSDVTKYLKYASNNNSINIITQNIRSISWNLPSYTTFLHRSGISWDIIVLSECWLPKTGAIPSLEGYNYAATTKHKTQNEGVVIYYHEQLQVSIEEPHVMDANCLLVKVNTDTCIICIYRPHGYKDSSNFVHSIDSLLKTPTKSTYKNILLCGDINIDILPNTSDKRSYDYLNVLASHGILPGHSFPTHNKTCLDHAMVKSNQEAICLVLETSITDHDCVAVGLHHGTRLEYTNKQINRIDYQHLDFEMKGLNLQPVLDCSDANTATDLLVDLLTSAIKKCTKPIATSKRKRISKPWITIGLLRCIRNRDNLHKK